MQLFLGKSEEKPFNLDAKNLSTHAVCMGMTGSGKTGLGIALLEEAALNGIPAIIIDPKGDMGNLLLAFPNLAPSDFAPWVEKADSAPQVAEEWKKGLSSWGEGKEKIEAYLKGVERTIYTPASNSGVPLSILNSFAAPQEELIADQVLSTTSSLLGLIGIEADPLKSKEHILISTILEHFWKEKKSLDLPSLIRYIQDPPFTEVGVFSLDTFYPSKERLALAMKLNKLLASNSFQAWMEGDPLDVERLLYTSEGKPRHSILYIAHLSDPERMFFLTLLFNAVLAWTRKQPGSSSLKALLYMDEIYGFFPATANPPSKAPMIALLKTARAFGLGIVLATQNPIDLDYRGLGNTGTWFIGNLQTERDRMRLVEGLQGNKDFSQLLSQCKKRHFIVHSIYDEKPFIFETRWTLSYLCGPLTLPQIQKLTPKRPASPPPAVSTTAKATPSQVVAIAKLHFIDSAKKCDLWIEKGISAPFRPDGKEVNWEEGTTWNVQEKQMPPASFSEDTLKRFSKSLSQYLYETATLDFFEIPSLKLVSKSGETKEDFKRRAESEIRASYEEKINAVEAKTSQRKIDAWISLGKTILGGIFSSKKLSKTNISNVGTSLKKMERTSSNSDTLINARDQEILNLEASIETVHVRPRKTDLVIVKLGIAPLYPSTPQSQ